jgi:hypothetical protein
MVEKWQNSATWLISRPLLHCSNVRLLPPRCGITCKPRSPPMKLMIVALLLVLSGCGQDAAADNAAALKRAADRSTPEAADILRNAAENGADVQSALQEASNA